MLVARGLRGFGMVRDVYRAGPCLGLDREMWQPVGDKCLNAEIQADPPLVAPECFVSSVSPDGAFIFSDGCDGPAAQTAAIARLPYDVVQAALARQRATAAGKPPLVGPPSPPGSIVVDGRTVTLPADMVPEKKGFPTWAKWTLGILAVAGVGAGAFVYRRRKRSA